MLTAPNAKDDGSESEQKRSKLLHLSAVLATTVRNTNATFSLILAGRGMVG